MLRTLVIAGIAAATLTLVTVMPSHAQFIEDTAPTFENGGVDPQKTGDPAAVAEAQRALAEFFDYTNREYSKGGFANPRQMREQIGNQQSNWLDRTMPLACGRLVGGYKNRNWVAGRGWVHEAPRHTGESQSVPCLFTAPTAGGGGPIPEQTIDPPAVAAAQKALTEFYALTNAEYSSGGFANPQAMREERGNENGRWMDQALALARGNFHCGFRCMNWIPNKGWRHEALPAPRETAAARNAASEPGSGLRWSAAMQATAGDTSSMLFPQPTTGVIRPSVTRDDAARSIMMRSPVSIDNDE